MPHPDTAVRLRALSVSRSVAEHLEAPRVGRVIATFSHSCYLDLGDQIVALVAPEFLNGPLNLVVAVPPGFAFDHLAVGEHVAATSEAIQIGAAVVIELSTAAHWDSTVQPYDRPPPGLRANQQSLATLLRAGAPPEALARTEDVPERVAGAMSFLADALRRQDAGAAGEAAGRLAGFGPGLTPSGDDFLAGALVAMAVLHPPRTPELRAAIVAAARNKTTKLSQSYLAAAARGEAAEPWHWLTAALGRNERPALTAAARAVLAFGETSGADMLAGFLVGLDALTPG